ncbi:hypothetical protein ACH5RR_034629 [Cinchona calisaya]|uniref:Homeobox-leucine zipper protein n=1 Tax=Cinchona calisaya TaxID=153742 RepID=A0ABD2YCP1_9GENT
MNRFSCLNSSGKSSTDNVGYSNELQAMLDGLEDEDSTEEFNCSIGKKKRLRIDQVQALERIFEVDNKLDPERKVKLAQELGLQPRQVAIWFQNRRARWKTKQLERDYHILKVNYEALQLNYSKVEQEKEGLVAQLRGLKEKLGEDDIETNNSTEKVATLLSSPNIISEKCYANLEVYRSPEAKRVIDFKEGLSDSDSSTGILNEDGNNILKVQPTFNNGLMDHQSGFSNLSDAAPVYHPYLLDSRDEMVKDYDQQQQFVKMEEQTHHFTADDSCNIFSVDQAPPVIWYFDPRNQ